MKARLALVGLLWLLTFSVQAQTKPTVRIGVLIDERTPEIAPLFQQMTDEIKAVVGEDATIDFSEDRTLVNNSDVSRAEANYNQLMTDDTDIVIAFGPINNVVISRQNEHRKPTILFGSVPGDFTELDRTKTSSGIHNLVYLVTSQSFTVDLEVFGELYDYKNIAVAVEESVAQSFAVTDVLDGVFANSDKTYGLIAFNSVDEIIAGLDGYDALYLGGGFLLTNEEILRLSDALLEKNMPSFTGTSAGDVRLGLMATNQLDENLDQFFRRIALSVEAIVNGTDPADLPLYLESRSELTINYNTAERLGVPLKYSFIATTNLVGDFESTVAEKRYNLRELINELLGANLGLKADAKDIDLAGQDLKTAKSNYLPELTSSVTGTYVDPALAAVSNGQNPEYSTTGNVTLSQTIFAAGATANIKIQDDLQKAQQETFNAAQLDAIFDGANAYFNALLLKANLQISSRNLDITKRNLQLAQQNYESGQSGKSDVLQFTSQVAQNTQTLVEAVNSLEQSFLVINQLLNQPVNRRIDVVDAELGKGLFEEYDYEVFNDFLDNPALREPFVEFLVSQAKKNAPELKSLAFNRSAIDRNLKLATNGRFLPTVALQGQYISVFNRSGAGAEVPMGFGTIPDSYYNASVNVSLPIFQRNQQNINRQTATIQKEQIDFSRQNFELNLERSVNAAVLDMINQIANIELSKVSEEAARESLELTQEAYATGAVTWVLLTEAQSNYLNAQLANASAVYNYLLSTLQLERFMGYFFLMHDTEENRAFRREFLTYLSNRN